ncbi:MAG: flagellar basal body P-ring formation chaperone FlgA [Desulfatiglandaceae bacterium]
MSASRLLCTIFCLIAVCVSGVVIPDTGSAVPVAVVDVFKQSEVNLDTIYLGDISRISGGDPKLIRKLKRVEMGRSPLPGHSRRIEEGHIWVRVKQFNIDASKVRLNIPDNAEVVRGFTVVSKGKIHELIRNYLHQTASWDNSKMRIREIQIKKDIVLPKGPLSFRVEPRDDKEICGKVPFAVNMAVGGKLEEKVWVVADIEVLRDVIVAKRPLRRHRQVTEDDIEVREMDMARLPSNFLTDYGKILGKRTTKSIDVNTILRPDLIEFPPLVKRGDVVTVIAESAGLRITAVGVVKEREGHQGEKIRVENIDSNKRIYAQVVNAKTVKVDF